VNTAPPVTAALQATLTPEAQKAKVVKSNDEAKSASQEQVRKSIDAEKTKNDKENAKANIEKVTKAEKEMKSDRVDSPIKSEKVDTPVKAEKVFSPITPATTTFTFTKNLTPFDFKTPEVTPESKPAHGTKGNPIVVNGPSPPAPHSTITSMQIDDMMRVVAALQRELSTLNGKFKALEEDQACVNQKVQELTDAEQRRRFLGSGTDKEPFNVNVTYCTYCYAQSTSWFYWLSIASGANRTIQVTKQTRASEVIRNARLLAKLSPADSQNPRLAINGENVGHNVMLSELDVTKDSKIAFIYDGADDEEL
jgi:hypothetical protein